MTGKIKVIHGDRFKIAINPNNGDATSHTMIEKDGFHQENKTMIFIQKEQCEINLTRLRCLRAAINFNRKVPPAIEIKNLPIMKHPGKGEDIRVKTQEVPQRLILICKNI